MKDSELRFYGLGYYDGRQLGYKSFEFNDGHSDMQRHMYKLGYDAGVADFCETEHEDEHNV